MKAGNKEIIEQLIHSEEAAIEELLEAQQLLRIRMDSYIKRNARQSDELDDHIMECRNTVEKLKLKIK